MLHSQTSLTLVNQQNGNLAFKLFSFEDNDPFDHLQRHNYFSVIWIMEGEGKAKVDFAEYPFGANSVFAFAPYQPYMFHQTSQVRGMGILFHSDFFCIHKHHEEVSSNGLLFNNVYSPPFSVIDPQTASQLRMITDQIRTEMQNPALAQYELIISYLKIILITLARVKRQEQPELERRTDIDEPPFILKNLRNAIEEHFKSRHSASEYADLLHITPKALGRIAMKHFNKTLTDLIAERIIMEAKRELYLTNKSVKEIAGELGYEDEHYFSRFFKTNAEISPQLYRDRVGFGRGIA